MSNFNSFLCMYYLLISILLCNSNSMNTVSQMQRYINKEYFKHIWYIFFNRRNRKICIWVGRIGMLHPFELNLPLKSVAHNNWCNPILEGCKYLDHNFQILNSNHSQQAFMHLVKLLVYCKSSFVLLLTSIADLRYLDCSKKQCFYTDFFWLTHRGRETHSQCIIFMGCKKTFLHLNWSFLCFAQFVLHSFFFCFFVILL